MVIGKGFGYAYTDLPGVAFNTLGNILNKVPSLAQEFRFSSQLFYRLSLFTI